MIRFEHVEKKYDDITPLRDVNVTINDGDVISVIGPSGAGKSTLLRAILMLDPPTAGTIYYNDVPIPHKGKELDNIRKKIGMVFQSFNLFGHKTIIENIMIPQIDLLGRSRQEAYNVAVELLAQVGLKDRALCYPDELSGGQKQRAAICRTVAMDPEIILFDEPTSSLDPTMVGEVQRVIGSLAGSGKTMMIVTHEMKFAREIANRVFYMDEGGICEDGTPEEIFEHPQKDSTRRFIRKLNVLEVDIAGEDYDFLSVYGRIEEYGRRTRIDYRMVGRIQIVFEELCSQVLLKTFPGLHLNMVVEYSEAENNVTMLIRYDGEPFDPENTHNVIALALAEHAMTEWKWSATADEGFTNRIEIKLS